MIFAMIYWLSTIQSIFAVPCMASNMNAEDYQARRKINVKNVSRREKQQTEQRKTQFSSRELKSQKLEMISLTKVTSKTAQIWVKKTEKRCMPGNQEHVRKGRVSWPLRHSLSSSLAESGCSYTDHSNIWFGLEEITKYFLDRKKNDKRMTWDSSGTNNRLATREQRISQLSYLAPQNYVLLVYRTKTLVVFYCRIV